MKPANWDSLSKKKRKRFSLGLQESARGRYLMARALAIAFDILHANGRGTDADDIEVLGELFQPGFRDELEANKPVPKERSVLRD